jgi:hypothetical protein
MFSLVTTARVATQQSVLLHLLVANQYALDAVALWLRHRVALRLQLLQTPVVKNVAHDSVF